MHKGSCVMLFRAFLAVLALAPIMLRDAAQARPERIVSLNLCADQYLIELADPEQIAALTLLSQDAELSYHAAKAQNFHTIRGLAEEVLALEPDLLITNPWGESDTLALLAEFEIPTLTMGFVTSFAEIRAETRTLAAAIGQKARGDRLIEHMEAALEAGPRAPSGQALNAVLFQRRGFTSGSGTLFHDVLARTGLRNFAAERGYKGVGRIGLEEVVGGDADYLILSEPVRPAEDLGTDLLLHPALRAIYPEAKRLYLPQALIVCGSPSFPAAAAHLRAQLKTHVLSPSGKAANPRP